jgi:PLP dependent protein
MERTLAARLHELRRRMAAATLASGRSEDSVTLVAVSKGHTAATVRAAARLGVEHYGESYLQEALPKIAALTGMELSWHFIGRLQANKTRQVAEHFAWVHGVDRLNIAARLSSQRGHFAPPLNVCLQVNIARDAAKAGIEAAAVNELATAVAQLPRLRLRGLMGMLSEKLDAAAAGSAMQAMHALLTDLQRRHQGIDTLSMGMSGDFEAAIRAGSTMVRIGTALFGPRP